MSVSSLSQTLAPMRPSSRESFRGSIRSPSPVDEKVNLRSQMSVLKHEIRHKQAQFNNLETALLRGPYPVSGASTSVTSSLHFQRRSSMEGLSTSPNSSSVTMNGFSHEGIREGVPTTFGVNGMSSPSKRAGSPTRTLSRIPVSSVGLARALAEEPSENRPSEVAPAINDSLSVDQFDTSPSSGLFPPVSPSKSSHRRSLAPGGTTRVLADLQAGVMNARSALENTKTQLRSSQRTVAQLTRQVEDMREGRERLRLENEGLNNVVARKERLLQEVLERARKAEAEAAQLKVQLKTETTTSKRTLKEMETHLTEATAISQRSEREYLTLRDSMKGISNQWQKDMAELKSNFKRQEAEWRSQVEDARQKHENLMKLVQESQEDRAGIAALKAEKQKLDEEFESNLRSEITSLSDVLEKTNRESEASAKIAAHVKDELDRIHRLIRASGRTSTG